MNGSRHVDIGVIQMMTGWSKRTVYNKANTHAWRRTITRPVRYHLDDVIATFTGG